MMKVRTSNPKSAGSVSKSRCRMKRGIVSLGESLRRASAGQRHDAEISAGSDRREPEATQTIAQATQFDRIVDPNIRHVGHDETRCRFIERLPLALVIETACVAQQRIDFFVLVPAR